MKKFFGLLFIILSVSLTSCIELLEEIKLNEDKSGSVFIGIESQVLASILDVVREQVSFDSISELEDLPSKLKERIINVKGISEVNSFDKVDDGRLGISFNFSNPTALNRAYFALAEVNKKWYHPNIIRVTKHKISRKDLTPQLINQLEKNYPKLKDSELTKFLSLKLVVKLPSPSISVYDGEKEVLTKTKNVRLNYGLSEILEEEKPTSFKIRF